MDIYLCKIKSRILAKTLSVRGCSRVVYANQMKCNQEKRTRDRKGLRGVKCGGTWQFNYTVSAVQTTLLPETSPRVDVIYGTPLGREIWSYFPPLKYL